VTECKFLEAYNATGCDFTLAKEAMDILYGVENEDEDEDENEDVETPSRTFVGKICRLGDLQAVQYLISHEHHFDKMAIFVSTLEGHIEIVKELFAHQSFPDLNIVQLIKSLYSEGLDDMLNVLIECGVVDKDKIDSIIEAVESQQE